MSMRLPREIIKRTMWAADAEHVGMFRLADIADGGPSQTPPTADQGNDWRAVMASKAGNKKQLLVDNSHRKWL